MLQYWLGYGEVYRIYYAGLRAGVAIIFTCLVLIVAACLLDMWTGIDAARANKEKICSRPLRKTGTKIVDYYRLVVFLC